MSGAITASVLMMVIKWKVTPKPQNPKSNTEWKIDNRSVLCVVLVSELLIVLCQSPTFSPAYLHRGCDYIELPCY